MYGLYIKGRGWIKQYDRNTSAFKCCRSAGNVHKEFLLKSKTELKTLKQKYEDSFAEVSFELRKLSKDELTDKRVVPSKKYESYYDPLDFTLQKCSDAYYDTYCVWCNLYMDTTEYKGRGSICIHCLKYFQERLDKHFSKVDVEVKKSWERAKLLDEI